MVENNFDDFDNLFFDTDFAASCVSGQAIGENKKFPHGVRVSSADVKTGDCFVAMKGANTDGHRYIAEAVKNGAGVVLAHTSYEENIKNIEGAADKVTFILCDDTEKALVHLAMTYKERIAPMTIGITGSVGKTTTRDLILKVLSAKHKAHGAAKSYNTRVGTAMSVLAMPEDTEYLVLEYGTNKKGEIADLISAFPAHELIFTEIAPTHLLGLSSIEGVFEAKMEMLSSKYAKYITYNADNPLLRGAAKTKFAHLSCTSIGRKDADTLISDEKLVWTSDGPYMEFYITYEDERRKITVPGWAEHINNAFAFAWATGLSYGVGEQAMLDLFEVHEPLKGRGAVTRINKKHWIIDETYNSSPVSLAGALSGLENLAELSGLAPYAVLGGMRELGEQSENLHREALKNCAFIKKLFLIGSEWEIFNLSENNKSFFWYPDTPSFIASPEYKNLKLTDGIFLYKASRGYELEAAL